MTVWVLVTAWFGLSWSSVETFQTKQLCEYERMAYPDRTTSQCTPVTIKKPTNE